jgi:hypothetical protein
VKMSRALALVSALFACAAQSQETASTVYGVGTKGCSEWTASRKLPGQTLLFESWLTGYISGANGAGLDMTPSNIQQMVGFVDNHCRVHPLDMIYEAAGQLVSELRTPPTPINQ